MRTISIYLRVTDHTTTEVTAQNRPKGERSFIIRNQPVTLRIGIFRHAASVAIMTKAELEAAGWKTWLLNISKNHSMMFPVYIQPDYDYETPSITVSKEGIISVVLNTTDTEESAAAINGMQVDMWEAELTGFSEKDTALETPLAILQWQIGYINRVADENADAPGLLESTYYTKEQVNELLRSIGYDGGARWGHIVGTLADQEDLQDALDDKADLDENGKVPDEQLPAIPTQLSELQDDATHRLVTDAEKEAWNTKAAGFSGDYNDLTNKPDIPSALSDLTDDTTHRTVSDSEKATWNGKSDFSGSYNDLSNKPSIPSSAADVGAIPATDKGANGGVATLDANGKVPSAQLPAMDYIPTSDKGAANGVAGLDANAKVPLASLRYADQNSGGIVHRINPTYGLENASDWTQIARAADNDINARTSPYKPIVPTNIDYAVRSVLSNITEIPAATSDYSLVDSSATTNNHSHVYTHAPTTAPTYRLPAVTDTTIVHYIELTVDFTTVQTYSFLDSNGDAVTPLFTPTVSAGDVYTFKCEYSTVKSAWLVYPQKQGATSSDFVMKSEVGVANGVAGLDANAKVLQGQLTVAGTVIGSVDQLGCIKVGSTQGFRVSNGYLNLHTPTDAAIASRSGASAAGFGAITTNNLNKAVTAALTDANHITLTALQQAVAKEVLGIQDSGGVEPTMGSGAPTSSTVGLYGQLYKDTVTSRMYLCVDVTADETDPDNVVMSYTWLELILSDQKGTANGVASLGSDGKVPSGQLPAIPPAPLLLNTPPTTTTVGSLGQVAVDTAHALTFKCISVDVDETDPQHPVTTYQWAEELNSTGGDILDSSLGFYASYPGITSYIDALNIVIGPNSSVPATAMYSVIVGEGCTLDANHTECLMVGAGLRTANAFQFVQGVYNASVVNAFRIVGAGASSANRANVEELSTTGNHYIAGGHQQKVTTIPAATSSYTLSEGVYVHAPQTASLYTLPAVSDVTRTHICVVTIVFSANVLTYEFQDSNGVTQEPMPLYGTIEPGAVVTFLCRYNPVILLWTIFPVQEGVIV